MTATRPRKKKGNPLGIYSLLGCALCGIGLSYDDFCRLGFDEFSEVFRVYARRREESFRGDWERVRFLAWSGLLPYMKPERSGNLTPQKLFPFAWDTPDAAVPVMSGEEQRARMEELAKRLGVELV